MGLHIRDKYLLLQLKNSLGGIGTMHIYPDQTKINY